MSEVNPYAPPLASADAEGPSLPYQVDGPYLIVRSGIRLPMRCVITNRPATSEDLIRRQIVWAPSFRLALARHRCNLEYCINAHDRRRILIWTKLVPIFCALVALALSFALASGLVLFLTIAGLQIAGRFVPRDPLRVKTARAKRFWIEGISPAFLADCVGDFDRDPSHDVAD